MVKIVWTEIAILDIKEIYDCIAHDSSRYALITENKIFQSIQPFKENPNLGRKVPEFNVNSIREVIDGSYRIIYRKVNDCQIDDWEGFHPA